MTVFFDIDDTLYDRGLPFITAAEEFFRGKVPDLRAAYRACSRRGNEVFLPSQRGEISMEEMYIYRWCRGFVDVGVNLSAEEALAFQHLYREKQGEIALTPVIESMLQRCAEKNAEIGVISNGPSEKQWSKIACLGLERFMKHERILVSGDVGIDKPDPEIFHLAEKRSGRAPGELVYIGDLLENDIAPALACGWHAVWFNRNAAPVPPDLCIDAMVTTEEELASAVLSQL